MEFLVLVDMEVLISGLKNLADSNKFRKISWGGDMF